jgi:HK97 family phage prohead protease
MTDDDGRKALSFPASIKAASDQRTGEFEAIVSVFGNVDHGGDRVMPGAFTNTLAEWRASGAPIPVIWNHDWNNPLAHIGKADPEQARETDDGLLVRGQLDMHDSYAAKVYDLLAERRVKEFSFGYQVRDSEQKDGATNLTDLELFEVGPTLKGMNPATQLLAVKSFTRAQAEAQQDLIDALTADDAAAVKRAAELLTAQLHADEKAGARLSKDTRAAIGQAIDLLSSLISADNGAEPKSIEAEASGKVSDKDLDLITQLNVYKETM